MTTDLERLPDAPQITPAQALAIRAATDAALAAGTRDAYVSSWWAWTQWCVATGNVPLPAAPVALAAFVTDRAAGWHPETDQRGRVHAPRTRMAVSSLNKDLAAIKEKHDRAGFDDPTANRDLRRMLKGVRRQLGTAATKQAHPVTTDEVRRILADIDLTTLRGLRDRAVILTGYAAALRRSELAELQVDDVRFRAQGAVVNLRSSKTDQESAGSLIGIVRGQHAETDPVLALQAWIQAARLSGADPLFQPINKAGVKVSGRALTGQSIAAILVDRAAAVGLGSLPITGHSMRAGHATAAAEAGVSAVRLARTTRHVNLSTLAKYIRPGEVLTDSTSSELGL